MKSQIEKATLALKDEILSGRCPVDSVLPPLPQLARRAKCSQATMKRGIRSLAHAGILKPVKKRGTVVLRRPPLGRVALLLSADAHTNLILQDPLCRHLAAVGFDCDLIPFPHDTQAAEVWRQRLSGPGTRPDCVVVLGPSGNYTAAMPGLSQLCPRRISFDADWCVSRSMDDSHVVTIDHRHAARQVVEHLLGLGHRRMAAFAHHTPDMGRSFSLEAAVQCRDLMEVAGGRCFLHYGVDGFDGILRLVREEGVTAYWALNDAGAVCVLTHLCRAGLDVPRDLSLIGRNDTPWSQQCSPSLTTISWNPEAVAETIEKAIRGCLADESREQIDFVAPRLVARESSGTPPKLPYSPQSTQRTEQNP